MKKVLIFIAILDALLWAEISGFRNVSGAEIYFLDVGQGDSSLIVFPAETSGRSGIKLLIDGGPMNGRVRKNLEGILPATDRYVDLIMISHPQLDHFGGLLEIIENYRVGAVLTSAEEGTSEAWKEFERLRKSKGIPRVKISEGDRVINGNSGFSVFSPDSFSPKDMNDSSISGILEISGVRTFFGGDIGSDKEAELARRYDLDVDILKVSHHGSKFSSASEFLREASPLVSVIEVGKNSYGHPTKEAVSRLLSVGTKIFRTDLAGFVRISIEDGKLQVYTQK